MNKFVRRFRAELARADDSESVSDFELQPPPRKNARRTSGLSQVLALLV